MRTSGIVLDAKVAREDQVTKELVKLFPHVPLHSNILVSTTPNHVVSAELAHKVQDGLSDKIDLDAIELDKPVTASQDSMKTSGLVSDALMEKEELPTKDNAHQLLLVPLQDNTLVFMTHKTVVNVDTAHKVQDGLSDKTEPAATELERLVTASQDLMRTSGIVSDVTVTKEDQLIKEHANQLPHVIKTFNISVSTTPNHAVHADTAHKDQDTLLDKTDLVAIE